MMYVVLILCLALVALSIKAITLGWRIDDLSIRLQATEIQVRGMDQRCMNRK